MREQFNLSVIIPTYNAEDVIGVCLDSIFNQTEKNIEIVCVDDGSTDSTLSILEDYADNNTNIRLVKQNHQGPGPARNLGIENATGKYISFLDADDRYYQKDAVEKMLSACMQEEVMICGSFLANDYFGEVQLVNIFPDVHFEKNIGKEVLFEDYQNDFYYQCFIFDRKIFDDKDMRFPLYLRYQDPPLLLKIMEKYNKFWVEPVYLYMYTYTENSGKEAKNIADVLKGISDNLEIAVKNNYYLLYKRLLDRLDNYYYDFILGNIDEKILELLCRISKVVKDSPWDEKLQLMEDVKERIKNYKNKCDSNYILEKLLDIYKGNYSKQYVDELKKYGCAVYGVGYLGTRLIDCLEFLKIPVKFAIDKNKANTHYRNINVIHPEELHGDTMIIVALISSDDVIKMIPNGRKMLIVDFLNELVKE